MTWTDEKLRKYGMKRMTNQDWVDSLEDGFKKLRGAFKRGPDGKIPLDENGKRLKEWEAIEANIKWAVTNGDSKLPIYMIRLIDDMISFWERMNLVIESELNPEF